MVEQRNFFSVHLKNLLWGTLETRFLGIKTFVFHGFGLFTILLIIELCAGDVGSTLCR